VKNLHLNRRLKWLNLVSEAGKGIKDSGLVAAGCRMQDNGIAAGKFASVSIYVAYCFNYLNYINLIVSALKWFLV